MMLITRVNFEKELGPQVKGFAKDPNYTGKIIRIKAAGPYYRHAGFQVPRVETIAAHFAEVEVLEGNRWIPLRSNGDSLEDLLKKHCK